MSIKSLMIPCIESQYTQEYIANVFWRQRIAKVSSITLIPYIKKSEVYSIAYITIDEWCDSEASYNFIQRVKNPEREARIVHHEDEWWPVQLNTHNNGDIYVGSYTAVFDSAYFTRDNSYEAESDAATSPCTEIDDEEWLRERPIKGLNNDYYSVDEAVSYLRNLIQLYENGWPEIQSQKHTPLIDPFLEIEDEILHFENELRIHQAVDKSGNVTLRDRKYPMGEATLRETACNCDEMFA